MRNVISQLHLYINYFNKHNTKMKKTFLDMIITDSITKNLIKYS